ncbi:unnamed protein product [Clavelina lepadiformis]|uniref:5-azacytidine-induced protein 1 n=1 Tax=Clavelina lepadiformis TaxID=159417 RepID=A0ABP0FGP1_CLALP
MSGNYSCYQTPVDLTLSGSQVSPPRKNITSSPRSTTSSRLRASMKSERNETNSSKRLANTSAAKSFSKSRPLSARKASKVKALAMSFPDKENRHQRDVGRSQDQSISSDDYLSFFEQSSTKSRSSYAKSSLSFQASSSAMTTDRVFKIPTSARSVSTVQGSMSTARSIEYDEKDVDGFLSLPAEVNLAKGDGSVNYLKSYIKNVNKYKDDPVDATDNISVHESVYAYATTSPRVSVASLREKDDIGFVQTGNDADFMASEVVEFQRAHSARKIQTWYRRHSLRRKTGEAAVKRMLSSKKEEIENNLLQNSLKISHRTEEEKKKQREQKAKEARMQAMKELQEKRERQKEAVRKVAEEEIELVKQKMESRKKSKSSKRQKTVQKLSNQATEDNIESKLEENEVEDIFKSAPGSSMDVADGRSPPSHNPVIEVGGAATSGETLKSRTTLDDVLATIKQLEEEPEHLPKPKSALDEKLSWIDELQSENQSVVSKVSGKSNKTNSNKRDADSLLTEAKLHSIMHYLDEVESTQTVVAKDTTSTEQLIHAEQSATEVTSQMLQVKLDLEEKSRSVSLLQNALGQQRELNIRQIKEQEKEFEQRLKLQKNQYESTIQRHLSFIDQLIDDKKALNDKCEKLVAEMKQADERYQKKIKQMTESHSVQLQKAKDVLIAAEKLRREKWIDEKTKKIKEMTVKGLEPEIQRLIAKHKEEMKKVKAIQEAELLRSDERAGQRYIRQTEELREQLEREKEAACTREREMARQRYEKQMEQEEIALQQQRKRLFAEVAEEKERMGQQAARQRNELNQLREQLEENNKIAASALRDEFEKSTDDASRRHREEMKLVEERLQVEKQAWQENYMKKQEAFMIQKERELKESVRRDRDNEIEAAILRLEDDMQQQRDELEKTTENRVKRIRDKYETEMREVERSEKQTQEKYNSMKVDFNEIESANLRLQSLCKQKEQEALDMEKIKNKLVEERSHVSDVIRQEFADRLVVTDEENKRMKTELSELRARQRLELERINNEKEEELAEVHKRVRHAIVKKEDTISQIRQEYEAAVKRADHLESLLEAQRKKLLGKKK